MVVIDGQEIENINENPALTPALKLKKHLNIVEQIQYHLENDTCTVFSVHMHQTATFLTSMEPSLITTAQITNLEKLITNKFNGILSKYYNDRYQLYLNQSNPELQENDKRSLFTMILHFLSISDTICNILETSRTNSNSRGNNSITARSNATTQPFNMVIKAIEDSPLFTEMIEFCLTAASHKEPNYLYFRSLMLRLCKWITNHINQWKDQFESNRLQETKKKGKPSNLNNTTNKRLTITYLIDIVKRLMLLYYKDNEVMTILMKMLNMFGNGSHTIPLHSNYLLLSEWSPSSSCYLLEILDVLVDNFDKDITYIYDLTSLLYLLSLMDMHKYCLRQVIIEQGSTSVILNMMYKILQLCSTSIQCSQYLYFIANIILNISNEYEPIDYILPLICQTTTLLESFLKFAHEYHRSGISPLIFEVIHVCIINSTTLRQYFVTMERLSSPTIVESLLLYVLVLGKSNYPPHPQWPLSKEQVIDSIKIICKLITVYCQSILEFNGQDNNSVKVFATYPNCIESISNALEYIDLQELPVILNTLNELCQLTNVKLSSIESLSLNVMKVLDRFMTIEVINNVCRLMTTLMADSYEMKERFTTNHVVLKPLLTKLVATMNDNDDTVEGIAQMIQTMCSPTHQLHDSMDEASLHALKQRHRVIQLNALGVMIPLYQCIVMKCIQQLSTFTHIAKSLLSILFDNPSIQFRFDEKCDWCLQLVKIVKASKQSDTFSKEVMIPFVKVFNEPFYKSCKSLQLLPRYIRCLLDLIYYYDGANMYDYLIDVTTVLNGFISSDDDNMQNIARKVITDDLVLLSAILVKNQQEPNVVMVFAKLLRCCYSAVDTDPSIDSLMQYIEVANVYWKDESKIEIFVEVLDMINKLIGYLSSLILATTCGYMQIIITEVFNKYLIIKVSNFDETILRLLSIVWEILDAYTLVGSETIKSFVTKVPILYTCVEESLSLCQDIENAQGHIHDLRRHCGAAFQLMCNYDSMFFDRWTLRSDIIPCMLLYIGSTARHKSWMSQDVSLAFKCVTFLHDRMQTDRIATLKALIGVHSCCNTLSHWCWYPHPPIALRSIEILENVLHEGINYASDASLLWKSFLETEYVLDSLVDELHNASFRSLEVMDKLTELLNWCDTQIHHNADGRYESLSVRVVNALSKQVDMDCVFSILSTTTNNNYESLVWKIFALSSNVFPNTLFDTCDKDLTTSICSVICSHLRKYRNNPSIIESILLTFSHTKIVDSIDHTIFIELIHIADQYPRHLELVSNALSVANSLVKCAEVTESIPIVLKMTRHQIEDITWPFRTRKPLYTLFATLMSRCPNRFVDENDIQVLIITTLQDYHSNGRMSDALSILVAMEKLLNESKQMYVELSKMPALFQLFADMFKSYWDDPGNRVIYDRILTISQNLTNKNTNNHCTTAIQHFFTVPGFAEILMNNILQCRDYSMPICTLSVYLIDASLDACISPPDYINIERSDDMVMKILNFGNFAKSFQTAIIYFCSNDNRLFTNFNYLQMFVNTAAIILTVPSDDEDEDNSHHGSWLQAIVTLLNRYLETGNKGKSFETEILQAVAVVLAVDLSLLDCDMVITALKCVRFGMKIVGQPNSDPRLFCSKLQSIWGNMWFPFGSVHGARENVQLIKIVCNLVPELITFINSTGVRFDSARLTFILSELIVKIPASHDTKSEISKQLVSTTIDLMKFVIETDKYITWQLVADVIVSDDNVTALQIINEHADDHQFIATSVPLVYALCQTLHKSENRKKCHDHNVIANYYRAFIACSATECALANPIEWLTIVKTLRLLSDNPDDLSLFKDIVMRQIYDTICTILLDHGPQSDEVLSQCCFMMIEYRDMWHELVPPANRKFQLYVQILKAAYTRMVNAFFRSKNIFKATCSNIISFLMFLQCIYDPLLDETSSIVDLTIVMCEMMVYDNMQTTCITTVDLVCQRLFLSHNETLINTKLLLLNPIASFIKALPLPINLNFVSDVIMSFEVLLASLPSEQIARAHWKDYQQCVLCIISNAPSKDDSHAIVIFSAVVWLCKQPDSVADWNSNVLESWTTLMAALNHFHRIENIDSKDVIQLCNTIVTIAPLVTHTQTTTTSSQSIGQLFDIVEITLVSLNSSENENKPRIVEKIDCILSLISSLVGVHNKNQKREQSLRNEMLRKCDQLLSFECIQLNDKLCLLICQLLECGIHVSYHTSYPSLLQSLLGLVNIHTANSELVPLLCQLIDDILGFSIGHDISSVAVNGMVGIARKLFDQSLTADIKLSEQCIRLLHSLSRAVITNVSMPPDLEELSQLDWTQLMLNHISVDNDVEVELLHTLVGLLSTPFVQASIAAHQRDSVNHLAKEVLALLTNKPSRYVLHSLVELITSLIGCGACLEDEGIAILGTLFVKYGRDQAIVQSLSSALNKLCSNYSSRMKVFVDCVCDCTHGELQQGSSNVVLNMLCYHLERINHGNLGTALPVIQSLVDMLLILLKYSQTNTISDSFTHMCVHRGVELLHSLLEVNRDNAHLGGVITKMISSLQAITEKRVKLTVAENVTVDSAVMNTAIAAAELTTTSILDVNVYKGSWRRSTPVAIKINRSKKSIADSMIQREYQLLTTLRHPRVVTVLGLCMTFKAPQSLSGALTEDSSMALVMEYMGKGNLRTVLNAEHTIMSWASKLTIAVDMCEGMEFLHESKVVHGSLSSENVLVDSHGRAKLTGFRNSSSDQPFLLGFKEDVFCFGLILWELITGKKLPYSEVTQCKKHINKIALTKEDLKNCLPVISSMMKHCLEIKATDRPAFSDLSDTLHQLHIQETKRWNDQLRVIPDGFICPITQDVMKDPVMLMDGHSYERKAIEDWLTRSGRSPLTNELLSDRTTLIENYALKSSIESFMKQNPHAKYS